MMNRDFVSDDQVISSLESKVADLETENSDLQGEIDELTQEVDRLKDQLSDMEAAKIAAEQVAEEYKDALDDIENIAARATK